MNLIFFQICIKNECYNIWDCKIRQKKFASSLTWKYFYKISLLYRNNIIKNYITVQNKIREKEREKGVSKMI